MPEQTFKYLENLVTDEVHKLPVDEQGRGRPLEQCNTDAVDHKAWLTVEEAESRPVKDRCGHCWPAEVGAEGD